MTLKLHNTLTTALEEFTPLRPEGVSIYSCGPTVYDHAHIGNLSAFISADILRRTVAAQGLATKHVMNFTDVDDKTIRRSREIYPELDPKEALYKLTSEYSNLFLKDMQLIGNDISALTFISATNDDTIEGMRRLIAELYKDGFAYIANDGVYFSIDAYRKSGKTYGQLVEITDKNTSSERIQNDEYDKESAHDFALWKTQKPDEPAWEFTLGGHDLTGRPGWHIECSVMSRIELGQPFDIHTGGIDLTFPHHENEIAQSTAGNPNPIYAGTFVHNEHILVDGKKMSKSANNFFTLSDLIEKGIDPLAFRLLVLQSHYRKQTNFSLENIESANNRLTHWRAIAALRWQTSSQDAHVISKKVTQATEQIQNALSNDLNTPEALQVIDDISTALENIPIPEIPQNAIVELLQAIDNLLGLQLIDATPDIDMTTKQIISDRENARQNKNWAESDKLRSDLESHGVQIRDTPNGTIWSYA